MDPLLKALLAAMPKRLALHPVSMVLSILILGSVAWWLRDLDKLVDRAPSVMLFASLILVAYVIQWTASAAWDLRKEHRIRAAAETHLRSLSNDEKAIVDEILEAGTVELPPSRQAPAQRLKEIGILAEIRVEARGFFRTYYLMDRAKKIIKRLDRMQAA